MTQETTIHSTNNQPRMKIADIIIGKRYRQNIGDIAELTKSISEVGLLHPIVVAPDHRLIAGQRRLKAVEELGWAEVPVHIIHNLDDAFLCLRAERDEIKFRKEFTPSEAVAIGEALEELEKPKAAKPMAKLRRSLSHFFVSFRLCQEYILSTDRSAKLCGR